MSIVTVNNDINELNPLAKLLLSLALEEIKTLGITPLIVETYRSQERQDYLYAQGRTRSLKSPKITWTKNSIHTLRNAVDVIPMRNNEAIWNGKDKETLTIIRVMLKYGWEAGANWSENVDSPHFQIKGVTTTGKEYSSFNTNSYITKMVQSSLNNKLDTNLKINGIWDTNTTTKVNQWRKLKGYKTMSGSLGVTALNALLS